jgi:hypothetical protein
MRESEEELRARTDELRRIAGWLHASLLSAKREWEEAGRPRVGRYRTPSFVIPASGFHNSCSIADCRLPGSYRLESTGQGEYLCVEHFLLVRDIAYEG